MDNKTIYNLKIDTKKEAILNDNYYDEINKLIRDKFSGKSDFKVLIMNEDGPVNEELNAITDY